MVNFEVKAGHKFLISRGFVAVEITNLDYQAYTCACDGLKYLAERG